jgi:hypothetical protein
MTPIQSALSIFKENSIDPNYMLEYHLANGIVFSDDKTFMLAIPCDDEDTETAVPIDKANCVFISMLAGDMKHAMEAFQDTFDFIAFKRQFKNSNHTRFYSYTQFHNKLKQNHGQ